MASLVPEFLMNWIQWSLGVFYSLPEWIQYLTITTWKILFVLIAVILIVAFSTYFERKVIGSMQARVGPNRVGPLGLGQPFADVIKLLIKEVVVPSQSSKFLFVMLCLFHPLNFGVKHDNICHIHFRTNVFQLILNKFKIIYNANNQNNCFKFSVFCN